jgi:hypothetical protein
LPVARRTILVRDAIAIVGILISSGGLASSRQGNESGSEKLHDAEMMT